MEHEFLQHERAEAVCMGFIDVKKAATLLYRCVSEQTLLREPATGLHLSVAWLIMQVPHSRFWLVQMSLSHLSLPLALGPLQGWPCLAAGQLPRP